VVKVRLEGLKIARARGKYYVYVRSTGEGLIKGFAGDKASLLRRLAMPDLIGAYNVRRKRDPKSYPERTLGWLVEWFTDPDQCPKFKDLSETTQEEYKDRLIYLEPEFDYPLAQITAPDIYVVRDKVAKEKWPAYADKMVTALSTMFKLAVQRGWMISNPASGIDRIYKPDTNANREWRPEEWRTVMERAPLHLRIAYMIARHAGYRSQSIVKVQWSNYRVDDRFGKCFRMTHKKNSEMHWIPTAPILQEFLGELTRSSPFVATRHNGQPWESEAQLQKQSSNFLAKLTAKGFVDPGLTLHGLRATFACEIKRVTGANDDQVAAALGDRDKRMGEHYTRHVEQENKIIFLFASQQWMDGTKSDLENGRPDFGKQHGTRTVKPSGIKSLNPPEGTKGEP
jgi:integrase